MQLELHMSFIDANGADVTGTETVAGYHFADFFSSDTTEILELANGDTETANEWLKSAYLGPDIDGVHVTWTISQGAEG